MKLANLFKTIMISAIFSLATNVVYAGPSSILFILDSSGSMAGKIDDTSKMVIAKQSLEKLLSDLPKDTQTGLMVYGHREKKSCTDVEVAIPLGLANPERLNEVLRRLAPNGKTPIAYSLEQSSGAFVGLNKGNNNIVLISDGIETCGGDPCRTAETLAKSNINVRIHVVGFDISAKDRKQLECIARVGKGKYFAANSTEGFTKAVTEAIKVAQAETRPKPDPAPKWEVYFEDNFDGDFLGEHWEVQNPDPEAYIVEEGSLGILSSKNVTLLDRNAKMQNLFKLAKPLPRGNWRITMRVKPGVSTFREAFSLALYKDKDNFLSTTAFALMDGFTGLMYIDVQGNKVRKGNNTQFRKRLITSKKGLGRRNFTQNSTPYYDWTNKNLKAIQLRIRKTGRSYFISAMVEGEATMANGKKPQWVELEKLTSLRSPGKSLLFTVGQTKGTSIYNNVVGGETFSQVDWVKIETMN